MARASELWEPFDWQSLRPQPVIGVDEAGRGCLAGSVFAGAVCFRDQDDFSLYRDSKLISEERRELLFDRLSSLHHVGVGFATVSEIEAYNILGAALLAMKRAVQALGFTSGHVIVDGNQKIRDLSSSFTQTTLVKGDLRAQPVGAASIIAKVSRDREMRAMADKYPEYGFERHKGYATLDHQDAIRKFGPLEIHRKTFSGVREFL